MANPLRFLDESFACVDEDGQRWFLVEVTQRIHRGRYLLRPGRDTRAVFLGAADQIRGQFSKSYGPGGCLKHWIRNNWGAILRPVQYHVETAPLESNALVPDKSYDTGIYAATARDGELVILVSGALNCLSTALGVLGGL